MDGAPSEAARTIAVLDAIEQATVTVGAVIDCVKAGTCRGMKAGSVNWFDQVNIPVFTFAEGEYTYALRAGRDGSLSIWITPPGSRVPNSLLSVGLDGKVLSGELGPQPGDRAPQRMTPEESEKWRQAHRAFFVRRGSNEVVGEEHRPYWETEATRALAAIRRQFAERAPN